MKLSEVKTALDTIETLHFELPNGHSLASHFHVTEIGLLNKDFIDCGGTVRHEKTVSFQLWETNDYDHRLEATKLLFIIALAEKTLGLEDWEVEVEYQIDTIGKFGLKFNGTTFQLVTKSTACLASDACGTPKEKKKVRLSNLQENSSCYILGTGCC